MTPFFDAISAGVTGTPGAGSITIGTVTSGFRAFSTLPSNTIVSYRVVDGSAWENGLGLWDGTTLVRGLKYSSTGSLLSLTSAAVVSLIVPADEVQPHIGGGKWGLWSSNAGSSTSSAFGMTAPTANGTAAAATIATTNFLTRQHRTQYTSATTANAIGGWTNAGNTIKVARSATAFMGGFEMVARFGASQLVTGPRFASGLFNSPPTTSEPSSALNQAAFIKDSTDTNWQFCTNDGTGSGTKTDTGIPIAANDWFETAVWCAPGASEIFGSLVRLNNPSGGIWYGSRTTDLPVADTSMLPACYGGLNGSNTGTALIFEPGSLYLRTSF